MWLWKFLKSLFLYFTFSSNELERENLTCPKVSELSSSPEYEELDKLFSELIMLKEENKISREFQSQDVFFLDSEPDKMVYTQLVLEEGLDEDLRVMRIHKELSAHQDSSTPYVTEFITSRCVKLEDDLYYFMNDESRVYGSMAFPFQDDPRLKIDFALTALRLDFYNRVLDKFRLFSYSDYKFTALQKSQILYKVNQTGGPAAIRTYDPFFDLLYWITPLNGIDGNESGQRLDLFFIAKVLLQLEFDFLYIYMPEITQKEIKKMQLNPGDEDPKELEARLSGVYILPESVTKIAVFPDSCEKMPLKDRRIVQKLFDYLDSLLKVTDTLQNSEKQINAIRDLLGFLARSVNLIFKQGNQEKIFDRDQEGSMERNLINAIKNVNVKKSEDLNKSLPESIRKSKKNNKREVISTQKIRTEFQNFTTDQKVKENRASAQSRIRLRNLENNKFLSLKPKLQLTSLSRPKVSFKKQNSESQETSNQPQNNNISNSQTQEDTINLMRSDQEEDEREETEKNFKILEEDTHRRFFEKIISACKNDENILKNPFLEPVIEENLDLVQELERQHLANVKKVDTLLL